MHTSKISKNTLVLQDEWVKLSIGVSLTKVLGFIHYSSLSWFIVSHIILGSGTMHHTSQASQKWSQTSQQTPYPLVDHTGQICLVASCIFFLQ